ncbi:MAG: hypothetical protein GXO62_04535 [Epsilonproteobacteria bacterium]|nr:hypothetical protein [Campylobacterota bacterium]
MTKETLKEVGKGFINIGNGIIIITAINGLFNFNEKIGSNPLPIIGGVILTVSFYIAGIIVLNKGTENG